MRFNEALRKVTLDFKQKFLGECLNGEHCPEGVGPGLIPHPLDPAGGLHTGTLDEADVLFDPVAGHPHDGVGSRQVPHTNLGGVTFAQHHQHFYRLIFCADRWIDLAHLFSDFLNWGSVANRLFVVYTEVLTRCTVQRLGILPSFVISGNFKLALYGSDANFLPDALLCDTGSLGVLANLVIDRWRWFTPTSTPTIDPGVYWLGWVCDTDFVAAISGLTIHCTNTMTTAEINLLDGVSSTYYQDGAWTLPNPMIETMHALTRFHALGMRIIV